MDEQLKRLVDDEKGEMEEDEVRGIAGFLEHFTRLDFRKSGEDLVVRYRFRVGWKIVDHTVTFRPRRTVDQILESATPRGDE